MGYSKVGWIVVIIGSSLFAQNMPLDRKDYIGLNLGATYSWLSNAPGFYFPYVYQYDIRQPSVAQKMRFLELGSGIGFHAGISLELGMLDDAALRLNVRYVLHRTAQREQAWYDCTGNLGPSGSAVLESHYSAKWQYIGGDIFLRKSIFGDRIYGLIGAGYLYLMDDKFSGEQRIVTSDRDCEYLWLPAGTRSGNSSVAVRDQTSNNFYATSQYLAKIGVGGFIPIADNLVLSPEIILNIPLVRMLSASAEAAYDRIPAVTPKMWSADVGLSIRYAIGKSKPKGVPHAPSIDIVKAIPVNNVKPKGYALTGKVRNSVDSIPVPADILVTRLDSAAPTIVASTNLVGYYNVTVPSRGTYSVTATARDYLFGSTLFIVNPDGSIASRHDIALSPENGTIRLLIFFDIDRAELRDISYPELDRAVQVLKESPKLEVEIAGHTDSTGSLEHNSELSLRRANAVRDYMIAKGVRGERITAQGYGAARPVAPNSSESGRAENRRVEFVVRKR